MFLSVKEMERRKIVFNEALPPGKIDFAGQDVEQSSPLIATGSAELLAHSDEEVRVKGHYAVEMAAECDRCLGRARFSLDESFDLFYRPASELTREEDVEIEDGDTEIGFYEGAGLELEDILREQVLLALPMQRICSDACKGICPVCGANRNEEECGCDAHPVDDRWEAFRKLQL